MPLLELWWTLVAFQQQDADIQADRAALQTLLQQRANGPFIPADQLRAKLASQF